MRTNWYLFSNFLFRNKSNAPPDRSSDASAVRTHAFDGRALNERNLSWNGLELKMQQKKIGFMADGHGCVVAGVYFSATFV